ncbi:FIG022708: hypothetical protein [hydrothermal vent metagenome]|uniref:Calcineurin-like phosphoesterase domain-containing protein n=1 Tax=hydrothermal vent metagenome TaxID=652676 RepID=A0A1W1EDJ7_9ZZZZ
MTKIHEGAIFIADSHYPHHGSSFLDILKDIESKKVSTTQVFLMGDNFDLLFGYNEYIKTFSNDVIELLQKLSKTIDIYYFEGNHDFCIEELFPDIKVYSREEQPVLFSLNEKKVALSHGDKYATGFGYDAFCKILRSKRTLLLLKPFEISIIDDRMKKLSKKNICHDFTGFEKRVETILKNYKDVDLVIEGHYHQAKIVDKYISLPSQACQNKVAIIQDGEIIFKRL